MTPWNLILSTPRLETFTGDRYLTLGWKRHSAEGDFHHFFAHQIIDASDSTTTALYPRLFAHLLLDELPQEALPELLEYLASAWSFYTLPLELVPPQARRVLKGKVVRRSERPTYSLPDEE
jgi:hypothetical protein